MVEGWSLGRSVKRPIDRRPGARASYPPPVYSHKVDKTGKAGCGPPTGDIGKLEPLKATRAAERLHGADGPSSVPAQGADPVGSRGGELVGCQAERMHVSLQVVAGLAGTGLIVFGAETFAERMSAASACLGVTVFVLAVLLARPSPRRLVYANSGKPVPPSTPPEYDDVKATVVLVGSAWKVSQQSVTDGSCPPGS